MVLKFVIVATPRGLLYYQFIHSTQNFSLGFWKKCTLGMKPLQICFQTEDGSIRSYTFLRMVKMKGLTLRLAIQYSYPSGQNTSFNIKLHRSRL